MGSKREEKARNEKIVSIGSGVATLVKSKGCVKIWSKDLRVIETMIVEHHQELKEKWNGHFNIDR